MAIAANFQRHGDVEVPETLNPKACFCDFRGRQELRGNPPPGHTIGGVETLDIEGL